MAADLILTNGVVHTVDAARSVRQAVAVTDGRIVAVGTASEVAELEGPGTRTVDVEGGMVLPWADTSGRCATSRRATGRRSTYSASVSTPAPTPTRSGFSAAAGR
jgi:predicted amidohydrolase